MARKIRDPRSRTRIIEAAWRVVGGNGVPGATMRAIAAEAGVSTGFVTHYFADKQELIAEVLRHNNLRARDRVSAAIADRSGLDALEAAVEALLPLSAERRREWQVWVASWGPTSPGEGPAEELRGGWRFVQRLLTGLLQQAVDEGELPEELDLAYEAERLVTMVAGVGLIAGVEPPDRVRSNARRMLADQLDSLKAKLIEEIR